MVDLDYRTVIDIEKCEACDDGLSKAATRCSDAIPLIPETAREDDYRTAFAHDRDRILYSTPFQRLVYKTQMFCGANPSKYTTRLLHTLKVAQIARTISRALSLNEDLTEAIALGHDIGHAPFGHTGEDILRKRTINVNGFEHNEEGVWVALFSRERGLNLSTVTLEGILKHTKFSFKPYNENGVARSDPFAEIKLTRPREEPQILDNVFKYMGPPDAKQDVTFLALPSYEAQIVDISDEIAYVVHDLEDSLVRRIVESADLPPEWHSEFGGDPRDGINGLVKGVVLENCTKIREASENGSRIELSHTDRLAKLILIMKEWYSYMHTTKLLNQKTWAEQVMNEAFDLFLKDGDLLKKSVDPFDYRAIVQHPFRGESLVAHCIATLTDHELSSIGSVHLGIDPPA
ncbi:dGTP triphosphohydrolase [Chloroflexota bacterium]